MKEQSCQLSRNRRTTSIAQRRKAAKQTKESFLASLFALASLREVVWQDKSENEGTKLADCGISKPAVCLENKMVSNKRGWPTTSQVIENKQLNVLPSRLAVRLSSVAHVH
jgi:hypothetical protein